MLGDLDEQEWQEWSELSDQLQTGPSPSLEATAAAIETELSQNNSSPLPSDLADRLRRDSVAFAVEENDSPKIVSGNFSSRILSSPQVAWGIAAALALLLIANTLIKDPAPSIKPVVETPPLEQRASDLLVSDFDGLESYEGMTGKVVWSDSLQEGYMALTGLPKNNPDNKQYQLWIVDPSRDSKPVDGGVFDIPPGDGPAIIPIRNPVPVSKPAAFLITLEKPGGVVVSDQEIKVALATPT